MSDKAVEADPAIGFLCPYCGEYNYVADTLQNSEEYEGSAVESDNICCGKCRKDTLVIRYI